MLLTAKGSLLASSVLRSKLTWIVFLVYAFIGMSIYSNTLFADFQYDDRMAILNNPAILNIRDISAIWNAFNTRFVLGLSFAFNYAIGQYQVFGFHLINIWIHIFNACLTFLFVHLTFQTPLVKKEPHRLHPVSVSAVAGLIFLIHPIQTESVSYLWQRGTSLAVLFYLSGTVLFILGRMRNQIRWIALSFAIMILAMLTKEITVTFPIMILAYDRFFLRQKHLRIYLPFVAAMALIPILLIRPEPLTMELMDKQTVRPEGGLSRILHDMTRTSDIRQGLTREIFTLSEIVVLRNYWSLLFVPANQNIDHDIPWISDRTDSRVLLSLAFHLAMFFLGVGLYRRHRLLSFGIFWVYLHLVLESLVIVSPDLLFEHRLYLPMVGFAALTSTALHLIFRTRRTILVIVGIIVFVFSFATVRRNKVWRNEYTLWSDAVLKSPGKARANNNMGAVLVHQGRYRQAIQYCERALEANPNYVDAYQIMGAAYGFLGNLQKKVEYYDIARQRDPRNSKRYLDLAQVLDELGQYDRALPYAYKALQIGGRRADTFNELAFIYWRLNNIPFAVRYYHDALKIDSLFYSANLNLGVLYGTLNETEKAEHYLRLAMKIDTANPAAYYNLGYLYETRGDSELAREFYHKAIQQDPYFTKAVEALQNLTRGGGPPE